MRKKILTGVLLALLLAGCSGENDEPEQIPAPAPKENTETENTETENTETENTETPDNPETPPAKVFAAKYRVARLFVETDGELAVDSKEKKDSRACTIRIESDSAAWNYEGRGSIRGRGNSTWLWYPKKP